jgi:DNA invertase Pin-like site-specific DNA recombinase
MLRIGYVRLHDEDAGDETAALKMEGCHVIRAEEPLGHGVGETQVLDSILDFIAAGDQLVVSRIDHLASSSRRLLDVLDRLESRGASLFVLEPEMSTEGPAGPALRAVLQAMARVEPPTARRRRSAAAVQEIRDLQRAGVGPVEIARRLGVSRMTVWRKLKAGQAAQA